MSIPDEGYRQMSITPLTITGVSQFSSDLQTILNRAVQIAQIPVTALQNKDADLLQQKTLLGSLNGSVAQLGAALKQLGDTASTQALGASTSDSTIVTATSAGATTPATYAINSIT